VVYVPVVEKQILWTKRCKDKSLVGTVKETIMQVSMSKKWASKPALDENGDPLLTKSGKKVLRKSYSVLQDDFYNYMKAAGYTDIERGERGSSEEHLTVTQFKVEREQARLVQLQQMTVQLNEEREEAEKKAKQAKAKLDDMAPKLKAVEELSDRFSADPETVLPQPGTLETAKSYREKKAKPLFHKIIKTLRALYRTYLDLKGKFDRLQTAYDREVSRNRNLSQRFEVLVTEQTELQNQLKNFERVKRAYGPERVEETIRQVKQQEQVARRKRERGR
jgi:predicted nuclease with TOPRIM domain